MAYIHLPSEDIKWKLGPNNLTYMPIQNDILIHPLK